MGVPKPPITSASCNRTSYSHAGFHVMTTFYSLEIVHQTIDLGYVLTVLGLLQPPSPHLSPKCRWALLSLQVLTNEDVEAAPSMPELERRTDTQTSFKPLQDKPVKVLDHLTPRRLVIPCSTCIASESRQDIVNTRVCRKTLCMLRIDKLFTCIKAHPSPSPRMQQANQKSMGWS